MKPGRRLFVDSVTRHAIWIPEAKCHCRACGSRAALCFDHDRWTPWPYRRRILCIKCNLQKGPRRYVSYPDGTCWKPGMPVGARVPSPHVVRRVAIAARLKKRLLAAGIRWIDVASAAGATRPHVCNVLAGRDRSQKIVEAAERLLVASRA